MNTAPPSAAAPAPDPRPEPESSSALEGAPLPAALSPGDIAQHPLVKKTIELLGARVVSVQPRVKKE